MCRVDDALPGPDLKVSGVPSPDLVPPLPRLPRLQPGLDAVWKKSGHHSSKLHARGRSEDPSWDQIGRPEWYPCAPQYLGARGPLSQGRTPRTEGAHLRSKSTRGLQSTHTRAQTPGFPLSFPYRVESLIQGRACRATANRDTVTGPSSYLSTRTSPRGHLLLSSRRMEFPELQFGGVI